MFIPAEALDRVAFIKSQLGLDDAQAVVERAIRLLDLVVCALKLEGAGLALKHRDGTVDVLEVEGAASVK